MTQYNQIGEFGFADVLTKRLTTPGGSNSPAVAPEIFPTLVLETDRPEWGYLKGEWPYSRGLLVASAGAGAHVSVGLTNPSDSKTVVVIKALWADVLCRISMQPADTTSSTTAGLRRDSRIPIAALSRSLLIQGNTLTAGLPVRQAFLPANTLLELPFIVLPGGSVTIHTATDNLALSATIAWTERGAQPGELG